MDSQRERLLMRLRKYVGKGKINDGSRIYHDLNVAGDDAFEMLDEISAEFKLDFAEMRFSDYFPNEYEAMPEYIGRLFGFKTKRRPLSVDHLLRVVESGHWREPSTDVEAG